MGNELIGWLRIISFIFNENLCSIQQITFIHKITSLKRCEYLEIKEFLHTFQKKKEANRPWRLPEYHSPLMDLSRSHMFAF